MTEKPAEQTEQQEVEEPKQEVEEPKQEVEEPKQEVAEPKPGKITVSPKKKQKDPKKVAQGKRLAQISGKAKREKMRREIEEETQLDFSVDYRTLLYFGVPSVVFAGLYLYFSDRNRRLQEANPPKKKTESPLKKNSPPKIKKKCRQPIRLSLRRN